MENIKEKYEQAKKIKLAMGGSKLFSNAGKDICEWDTLGTVQQLLIDGGVGAPIFARKSEAPDFYTYVSEGEIWAPVEIVDVLRPGYKMHEFHKRASARDAPMVHTHSGRDVLKQLWQPLREQITKKSQKNYPVSTCLMVYFNIGRFSFPSMDTPFDQYLLEEHARESFSNVSKFSSVFVLDSSMRSLVQLHPIPRVIVPDRQT